MRFFLRFQEKNQQTRIFPKMDSFALSILLSYPFRGNLSSSIFRSNSLRFACPLGKLQMQFMPFPSNTKKPQFPAVIFQAGVCRGIALRLACSCG